MKDTKVIVIAMAFLFSNCGNNDKDIHPEDNDALFVGKWEMISLTGGFAPNEVFSNEAIIWEFSSNDSVTIKLDTLLSDQSRIPLKVDTTINYTYDSLNISIGDKEYEYDLQDKTLKLIDDLASDGFMLEFEKSE